MRYKNTSYDHLVAMLEALQDDPSKDWYEYPCLKWDRAIDTNTGYGVLRVPSKRKKESAHRLAYALTHGFIPDGLSILHRCDFKPCIRPIHLWPGTHLDNMRDAAGKGRMHNTPKPGEEHHNAKLTDENVIEIRRLRARGVKLKILAARFHVSMAKICQIDLGQCWKHLL